MAMRILMVSIFAPHFFNWTRQLKNSGHEVYWLDLFDSRTAVKDIGIKEQISGWRYRWNHPGRSFLKNKAPKITSLINVFNERKLERILKKEIERIKPDVVQSFVMYLSGVPILRIMKNYPNLKWVYTAWGSDMYYYQSQPEHLAGMKKVLPHINYMFADCRRDHKIAEKYGFTGEFLGVFPGGGGYDLKKLANLETEYDKRNIILIKGYQKLHGKCVEILQAIEELKSELADYQIIVFGADPEVFDYIKSSYISSWTNFKIFGKIHRSEVLGLMGQSRIYIGNSSSDGIPNTLLEAIIMGAFPIQSNPGGATAEKITHKKNGLLINDPNDIKKIRNLIGFALQHNNILEEAVIWNRKNIRPKLDREKVKNEVLECYSQIEKEL